MVETGSAQLGSSRMFYCLVYPGEAYSFTFNGKEIMPLYDKTDNFSYFGLVLEK